MELTELKNGIEDLKSRIAKIRDCLDIPAKQTEKQNIEEQLSRPGFWDNQDSAKAVVSKLSALKAMIEPVLEAEKKSAGLAELFDMAVGENDQQALAEVEKDLAELGKKCAQIELTGLLSGPDDMKDCFFSIHAGAGGTESCDWANMLLRMYTRFFQQNKFDYEELDLTPGEEAGLRSITLKVSGPFAFGKLSCETGVHRLVRISPFDSNKRRHTSFAAVDCLPETEDVDIVIEEEDLKIDFYRAGGAGGQHVNKTSSAVRIAHIPTGIVVQCQNDRSQHRNKAEAMKMLKSRLYMLEQQKRDAELNKIYGSKGEIAWSNQIRSYVLQPYQLVKDHRTDFQTGNVNAVLDGDIEDFIDSYLQYRAEKKHKKIV
ncbi:MAG: peptide chain release factor 2 [Phycisphaerae bacterium]|nr:peptide chain release factor 2 [Phycisphaerae bacterium]